MNTILWWNSLSGASQIFYCIAIPATLVLLIQTVMMFIGMGEDSDVSDIDGDGLPDDVDVADDLPDSSEGVFGSSSDTDVSDAWGLEGLRIFTLRGIIAFLVVFGWVGALMDTSDAKLYVTIPVAFVCGFAMMLLLAILFKAVMGLRNDGNTDNKNAIGVSGKVQLTIPQSRTGEGKVHLMLQGSYVERDAVTDDEEAIPTGAEVVVVRLSGQTTLVVTKK